MPELPKVEQDFEADVAPYVAAIEEMIAANERFLSSIEHVQEAIDALHGKDVEINLNAAAVEAEVEAIKTVLDSIPDHKNVVVTTATTGEGTAPGNLDQRLLDSYLAKISEVEAADRALNERMLESYLAAVAQEEASHAAALAERVAAEKAADQAILDSYMAAVAEEEAAVNRFGTALAADMLGLTKDSRDAADGVQTVAGAAYAAVKGFQVFGIGLTGLHWIAMGTFEALSTLLPALTALGAGALAAAEGATWIADKMQAIYTASEATSSMLGTTSGQFLGLSGALQKAQTAADPGVYEALGGALNGLSQPMSNGRTLFQGFFSEGVDVIHMLDTFIAKVDVELRGALGSQLSTILGNGAKDLQGWGQVLGNLTHFITNISTAAPGLAQVLLSLLSVVTRLMVAFTNHQGLLTFLLVLEEVYRWGGLVSSIMGIVVSTIGNVVTGVGKLIGSLAMMGDVSKFTNLRVAMAGVDGEAAVLGTKLEGFAKFLTGPWGFAVSAAALALGFVIYKMATAQTAAQQWASSMEQAVNKANFSQGLADILADLPKLGQAYNSSSAAAKSFANGTDGARTALGRYDPALAQAAGNTKTFTDTQTQMIKQAADILSMNTKIGGSYYSLNTAMGLASAAGLTVGQAFDKQGHMTAVAKQQIDNLIRGYQAMDQTGTTLANDINAITVQTEMQQTKVQALNQAWDSFISNMTGVTSSVAGLYTDLTTIGNVTVEATNKIRAFSQGSQGMNLSVQQVAQQLKTFGASSAQVWANFDGAVGQGETALDSLRTAAAAGGITNASYTESIKGIVAQMLPYARYSATATSELSALAQQAGGPATTNFQTLKAWVGNTSTATDTLNHTVQTATQYMSNLSKIAQNLASTLDSAVAGALTKGTIDVKGIATATQNLEKQFQGAGNTLNSNTTPAVQKWAQQMYAAGQPESTAKALLDELLTRWHASPAAIAAANSALASYYGHLNNAASAEQNATSWADKLAAAIGRIPSTKNITITTRYITEGGAASAGINPSALIPPKAAGLAGGMRIPGYGGGDTVPALLEPGEAVVPKHLTSAVAPFLKAHGVPGFASGGPVGAAQAVVNAAQLKETAAAMVEAAAQHKETVAQASVTALEKLHHTPQVMTALKAAEHLLATDKASLKSAKTILGTDKAALASANAILFNDKVQALGGNVSPGDFVASLITGGKTKEALAAITQDAGMLARFFPKAAIPKPAALPPQFMSDYAAMTQPGMPSLTLRGSPAPAGGMVGGQTPTLTADHPAHIEVKLDGKTIWRNQQQLALKYSLRNNGVPTGLWKPK